jgi:exopolysaccharide biosynthesis polyprenyl glycosylphosphotransferase
MALTSKPSIEPDGNGRLAFIVPRQIHCLLNPINNQSTNLDRPTTPDVGRSSFTLSTMSTTQYPGAAPLSSVIPFPVRSEAQTDSATENIRRMELAINLVERLLDFVFLMAGVCSAYWIDAAWHGRTRVIAANESVLVAAAGFGLLIVLLLDKHGDYGSCLSLLAVRETERLLRVTISGFLLALPILLTVTKSVPRTVIALALITVPMLLAIEKWLVQEAIQMMLSWGPSRRKAVILGTGTLGRSIFSALSRSPKFGIDPVAFVDTGATTAEPVIYEASYLRKRMARVLPGPVTPMLLRKLSASVLIVAAPGVCAEEVAEVASMAEAAGISTYVIPEPFLEQADAMEFVELDGVMLARKATLRPRRLYQAAKRGMDIAASGFLLLALAPLLGVAALAVALTSSGPVIFEQSRAGRDGVLFDMYKLRSMYAESDRYAYSPKSGRDPRITPVGRFLRHTCVDELPQLVNVLRGEMSLVGPRPEMPFIVEQYEELHRRRLAVKPGLTGLWQLSGDRSSLIHENISYDLYYVRHCNFLMDAAILLHTLVFAFRGI